MRKLILTISLLLAACPQRTETPTPQPPAHKLGSYRPTGQPGTETVLVSQQLLAGATGAVLPAMIASVVTNPTAGDTFAVKSNTVTETYRFVAATNDAGTRYPDAGGVYDSGSGGTAHEVIRGATAAATQTALVARINASSNLISAVEVTGLSEYLSGTPTTVAVLYAKTFTTSPSTLRVYGSLTAVAGIQVVSFAGPSDYLPTSGTQANLPAADPAARRFGFGRVTASLNATEQHPIASLNNTSYAWNGAPGAGGAWVLPAYQAHASHHQNAGDDEVATATPAANSIPKTGATTKLAAGWIPTLAASGVSLYSSGLDNARPAASASLVGSYYYATDTNATYFCNTATTWRVASAGFGSDKATFKGFADATSAFKAAAPALNSLSGAFMFIPFANPSTYTYMFWDMNAGGGSRGIAVTAYHSGVDNEGVGFLVGGSGNIWPASTTFAGALNVVHAISWSFDGTNLRTSWDGAAVVVTTCATPPSASGDPVIIGTYGSGSYPAIPIEFVAAKTFSDAVDDAGLRALSGAAARAAYRIPTPTGNTIQVDINAARMLEGQIVYDVSGNKYLHGSTLTKTVYE